jgi:hypothetical protein
MIKELSSAFQLRWQIPDESLDSLSVGEFTGYNAVEVIRSTPAALDAVHTAGTIGLIGL